MTVTSYLLGTLFPFIFIFLPAVLVIRGIRRALRKRRVARTPAAFELPDLGAEDLERKLLEVQQNRWGLDVEQHPAASRRAREVLERRLAANRKAARALERKSASRKWSFGSAFVLAISVYVAIVSPALLYMKWINGGDIWHGHSYTQAEHSELHTPAR